MSVEEVVVRLSPETKKRLQRAAKSSGVSLYEYIRIVLEVHTDTDYLAARGGEK